MSALIRTLSRVMYCFVSLFESPCSYAFLVHLLFFFFNDTATTEIYTLSLHDALPIYEQPATPHGVSSDRSPQGRPSQKIRSEEHTSELQSPYDLVCRLLLEKKKQTKTPQPFTTTYTCTLPIPRTINIRSPQPTSMSYR